MKLKDLIKELKPEKVIGKTDIVVSDLTCDHSAVSAGSLFIAIKGENKDGRDFARQAETYGAKAVISETELEVGVTQIIVKNARIAMSVAAAAFYSHPERELSVIGVTGTNGKTSTAYTIYSIMNAEKIKCGFIGTIGVFYGDKKREANLTTPDPVELFGLLREMALDGVKAVAMEVSAHAIHYGKIYGIPFKVGVFTNLSQDHLDFFGTMEKYAEEKIRFFTEYRPAYSVVNSDDETGREILKKTENAISYGLYNPADVFAVDIEENKKGVSFVLNLFDRIYDVNAKVFGRFNVYNLMAAAISCTLVGLSVDAVAERLNCIKTIEGRTERVYDGKYSVYVDYAHTPDGLENALNSMRKICKGNLISLFGCGGNRDKDKREKMGEISGRLADFTVITSDNPRYEDPMDIIFDIEKGVLSATEKYVIIQDRKDATEYALSLANDGDVVLVAGKVAENYQDVLGVKNPYNDKQTINEIIRATK